MRQEPGRSGRLNHEEHEEHEGKAFFLVFTSCSSWFNLSEAYTMPK